MLKIDNKMIWVKKMTSMKFRYECKNCGKSGQAKGSIKTFINKGCKGLDEDRKLCGSHDFIIGN